LTVITTSAALEAMCKPDANGQVHRQEDRPEGAAAEYVGCA
jgi:hypothetical protein